jgi:hypothetical protein
VPMSPLPWATGDIGTVGTDGAATLDGTTFTVAGAGAGIADAADAFRFVYRQGPRWTAGGGPAARLRTQTGGAGAVAGVMVRDDRSSDVTSPGARFAFVGRRGDGRAVAYWRTKTRGRIGTATSAAVVPLGSRFRIQRTGLYVWSMEYSTDGSSWTVLSAPTIDMGASIVPFSGLAVASGDPASRSTATFDDVVVP